MKKNRVLLAGENRLFIDSIKTILEREADFAILGCVSCGVDAIRSARETFPDVIVADQLLPDINLLQVVREVRITQKNAKFLFLIKEETSELLAILGETKSVGIVQNTSDVYELILALRSVSKGESYINPGTITSLRAIPSDGRAFEDPLSEITQREKDVLYWLAKGMTNKEISKTLVLSEKTVKNHVSHILRKLDLTDRTKAAALAWQEGLPMMSEEFFLPPNGASGL